MSRNIAVNFTQRGIEVVDLDAADSFVINLSGANLFQDAISARRDECPQFFAKLLDLVEEHFSVAST